NSVYTGANALNSGLESAKTGANALSSGINSVYTGASALNSGIGTVSNGVNGLNSGISSATSGANKVNNGLESAKTGAEQLSAGLTSGYNNLNDNVKFSASAMSNFIASPIALKTIAINPVDSYGEGFAPYFMCIGLWVGAMYAYFVISALSRKFDGSFKKRFIKSFSIGAGICALQAIIMSAVLYFVLDLSIQHVGLFFLVNILTIVAIYSLFNGLHYIITPIMKGAIMILMLFEFTSCGGSYPIAMMPAFYKVVSKFAILTYGVGGMRMAISGINSSVFNKYITILILCIVIPTIIGFIVGYIRNHITHKRVLKEKSELVAEEELFNQYV
uniref:YhgE/Pip family protein n=1 Tax=uncultured Clostridium sp. TaxID=59620 RepID=UPI00262026D8